MTLDDPAALVERIVEGDPGAEAELVARYGSGLSYLLRKVTGNPVLSEDLLQETFRVVLRRVRAGELREPEKLGGFLRQTAKNLARAEHRRGGRWESMEDGGPDPVDPGEGQLAQVIRTEEAGMVRRVLRELRSIRDRQLLYRFYIAEEEKEEICRDLGLSSLNFNLVLFRARERFRKLVEEAESRGAMRWSDGP